MPGDLDPARTTTGPAWLLRHERREPAAQAVVTATGARTSYGAIAHGSPAGSETDFQHGVRAFSLLIGRVT